MTRRHPRTWCCALRAVLCCAGVAERDALRDAAVSCEVQIAASSQTARNTECLSPQVEMKIENSVWRSTHRC